LPIEVGGRKGGRGRNVEGGEEMREKKKNPTDRCKILIPAEVKGIFI